jgi:ABC-type lipoprotein export system ATPase subunit
MSSTSMVPLIDVDAVSKVYVLGDAELHALDRVSLTASRGEFIAVTGAGSAKRIIEARDRA